jgi:hypothetical protein
MIGCNRKSLPRTKQKSQSKPRQSKSLDKYKSIAEIQGFLQNCIAAEIWARCRAV